MTGVHLGDVLPGLREDTESTADKLGRRFGAAVDWDNLGHADDPLPDAPALDRASIEAEAGPDTAYKPRLHECTFRVPLGIRQPLYEAHRDQMLKRWLSEMDRQGYDLLSMGRIKVYPGPNPAVDLTTGRVIPGQREMIARAYFTERNPEVVRVEIPGDLFAPDPLRRLRTSDGDSDAE